MREPRHTVPRGRGRAGGGGLGQEGQEKGSTYATAYSTGTHGKATHDLRPKAICVGVQGKICTELLQQGGGWGGGAHRF